MTFILLVSSISMVSAFSFDLFKEEEPLRFDLTVKNPVFTLGKKIAEPFRLGQGQTGKAVIRIGGPKYQKFHLKLNGYETDIAGRSTWTIPRVQSGSYVLSASSPNHLPRQSHLSSVAVKLRQLMYT